MSLRTKLVLLFPDAPTGVFIQTLIEFLKLPLQ